MGILIALLIVNLALSCVVGWVSKQRGRSFWLGFWLSAFLSPIFGVLILIALPGGSTVKSAGTMSNGDSVAAREWSKVRSSLDVRDYDDFVQAFPGAQESMLALKQRRTLQDWQEIDQADGNVIEEFMGRPIFPALADEVRRTIELNAPLSASCAALLVKLSTKEQQQREELEALEREALLAKKAEQLRAAEEQKRASANARRLAGGLLAVTAVAAIAVVGVSSFQEMSLQKDIDEKTMQCAGLDAEILKLENQLETLVTPLNETLDRLSAEKTELERKWSERIAAQASVLRKQAEGRVTATVGSEPYRRDLLRITVSNGSDYCLWRHVPRYSGSGRESSDPKFVLFQGTTSFGTAERIYFFSGLMSKRIENEKDRFGFDMGCIVPSGAKKSFQVEPPDATGPAALRRAEVERLRLRGDSYNRAFVIDRVSPSDLNFYELSSTTSGNLVNWTAALVNWSSLAEKSLTNEDADRIAELSLQTRLLEADIRTLPVRTDLSKAKAVAGECRSALLDLTNTRTSNSAR